MMVPSSAETTAVDCSPPRLITRFGLLSVVFVAQAGSCVCTRPVAAVDDAVEPRDMRLPTTSRSALSQSFLDCVYHLPYRFAIGGMEDFQPHR